MRIGTVLSIFMFLFLIVPQIVFADYVLPYPSTMPGSRLYTFSMLLEKISRYWYFGSFGQFKYNLKYSDKYLVEAKTLFEYKQYFLAITALDSSNKYFQETRRTLNSVDNEKKDIKDKKKILQEASLKHTQVLVKLKEMLPDKILWEEEKSAPKHLKLFEEIDHAISIRVFK